MTGRELMSVREAAWCLDERHDLSRPRVARLLGTGIAGAPTRAAGALLYDAEAVRRLAAREVIAVADVSPSGLIERGLPRLVVARRAVDLLDHRSLAEQCTERWDISVYTRLVLDVVIERDGPIPMVITTCGFVLTGMEVTGFAAPRVQPRKRARLVVREPGAWFEELRETRLGTGPGAPFRFAELSRVPAATRR